MHVILLQNIKGLGRVGDIKAVSDGYGRNYLLAHNLAKLATDGNIKITESWKIKAQLEEKITSDKIREFIEKAKDIVLEFTKKASPTGKLFASLTKEEIAYELSKNIGVKIKPDSIDLQEHGEYIKHGGEHLIEVALLPKVKVSIKIVIRGE